MRSWVQRGTNHVQRLWSMRSRDIDASWAMVWTGVVLLAAPLLMTWEGAFRAFGWTLVAVGMVFVAFGSCLLAVAYGAARRRERDKLDAQALRGRHDGQKGDA